MMQVDNTSSNAEDLEELSFKNEIGTMENSTGKRKWVFPKKPKGKFTNYRSVVAYILIAAMVIVPFIKLPNGNPLFKFDVFNSQFILFGFPFFTSDFFLLAIGMIATIIFIVLFTVAYGRIFCGWICPQTIFMESVFRRIEYLVEGDRPKQMKLDKQEWDEEKIRKRLIKYTLFFLVSFIVANISLAYIVGIDALYKLVVDGPIENASSLIGLLIFTGLFYFIFGWFREQVCTLVCPYGRLQGVLIDKQTIVVHYDFKRGEGKNGRAKFRKNENRQETGKGDCIDCGNCVVVCPTGIDIRNGTQLECVNCTACIDACDDVMTKINLPTGLIRYASEANIESGAKFKFNFRMIAYTIVLVLILGVTFSFLGFRTNVEAKFLKVPGTDYTTQGKYITNDFQYTLYNKTNDVINLHLKLASHKGSKIEFISGPNNLKLNPGEIKQGTFTLKIPEDELTSYKERIKIGAYDQTGKMLDYYQTSFAGPFK